MVLLQAACIYSFLCLNWKCLTFDIFHDLFSMLQTLSLCYIFQQISHFVKMYILSFQKEFVILLARHNLISLCVCVSVNILSYTYNLFLYSPLSVQIKSIVLHSWVYIQANNMCHQFSSARFVLSFVWNCLLFRIPISFPCTYWARIYMCTAPSSIAIYIVNFNSCTTKMYVYHDSMGTVLKRALSTSLLALWSIHRSLYML